MRRFKNILYFADGQAGDSPALARAVRLAQSNQARLTLFDVLEPVETPPELADRHAIDLPAYLKERRLEALAELLAPYRQVDELTYTAVEFGTPFVEVIRAVARSGYDLVIKGANPPAGLAQRVLGSTDMHLLRKCPCPVWIDHPDAPPHYANVLAAVDPMARPGGDCSALVLELAVSLAARESARLSVVSAWELVGESALRHGRLHVPDAELQLMLQQAESRHRDALATALAAQDMDPGDSRVYLRKGEAATVIRDLAERLPADLIVMGTVGRVGIPGFFIGNTAEEVLQTTRSSVLAVKPAGFVSPVA